MNLQRTVDIAERADRVRSTARNDVRILSVGTQLVGQRLHLGIHVAALVDLADIGAVYAIEQHVARVLVGVVGVGNPALENQLAGHAHLAGRCSRLPRMVRLHGALGNDDVGLLVDRICHQEFELARLVAAGAKTGAIVALDVNLRATEVLAEARQMFERSRQVGE